MMLSVFGLLAIALAVDCLPVDRVRDPGEAEAGARMDRTVEPGEAGAEVVEAVVDLVEGSCIFADDARFLRRLAYVESADGTDDKTYAADYHGGIWQVRDLGYTFIC